MGAHSTLKRMVLVLLMDVTVLYSVGCVGLYILYRKVGPVTEVKQSHDLVSDSVM
jgi:hypothetical protein